MNFLQIDSTYLNFDRIAVVRDLSAAGASQKLVRVEFTCGHHVEFVTKAQDVLDWLAENSSKPPVATP